MTATSIGDPQPAPTAPLRRREVIYRHAALVRISHWLNALALFFLLGSGLNIFNAHPHLYWGLTGVNGDPSWFSLRKGWPGWLTIPSFRDLAAARHWHFMFAWLLVVNGAVYFLWSLFSGHFQRDLVPTKADVKGVGRSIVDHVRLRHPTGEAAKRYNVLQRLAYLGVISAIFLMVLTGLTLSPGVNGAAPWLLSVFGGRQSARSLHFITAAFILAFVCIHLIEVVLAGPLNEVRSMITGRYKVPPDAEHNASASR